MRVRAVLATAALLLTSPGVASAAEGRFRYSYHDGSGDVVTSALQDPSSRECLDIPEVQTGVAEHVFRPRNHTAGTTTASAMASGGGRRAPCAEPLAPARTRSGTTSHRVEWTRSGPADRASTPADPRGSPDQARLRVGQGVFVRNSEEPSRSY